MMNNVCTMRRDQFLPNEGLPRLDRRIAGLQDIVLKNSNLNVNEIVDWQRELDCLLARYVKLQLTEMRNH